MWVDIANLIGPKGEDGADGQRGEPGPINIGLNPDEPLRWDQTGGFTFQFVDGSEQTVNLPIASAQSAGLLRAGGALPSTGPRLLNNSIADGILITSGKVTVSRTGPFVILSLENVTMESGSALFQTFTILPTGFGPPNVLRENFPNSTATKQIAVFSGGLISIHPMSNYVYRKVIAYVTTDPWPSTLPGTAA